MVQLQMIAGVNPAGAAGHGIWWLVLAVVVLLLVAPLAYLMSKGDDPSHSSRPPRLHG